MEDKRKKPGVAFWATVVASLPVLYLAGFGPACWISSRMNSGASAVTAIYGPLLSWAAPANRIPWRGKTRLDRYAEAGAANDWNWVRNISYAPVTIGKTYEEHWVWQRGGNSPRSFFP